MVLNNYKKISVLKKALRLIYASNLNEIDPDLDWDEPWHKDVLTELNQKQQKENIENKNIIKIYDGDIPLLELNLIHKQDESPFLGSGAFTSVYNVDYNGKECALKIISKNSSDIGTGDISIDVYEKLLYIKDSLPNNWQKYIPEIYFMKDNVTVYVNEIKMSKNISIIIMEKLKHLSTVDGLKSSFDGAYSNNPKFDKKIYFDIVSNIFNETELSFFNDYELKSVSNNFKYKEYTVSLKSNFINLVNKEEYISNHIKNNIPDNKIVDGIFWWYMDHMKIDVTIELTDNKNQVIKKDNIELKSSDLIRVKESYDGLRNIDLNYIRGKKIIEEKLNIKFEQSAALVDIDDIFWNLIRKHHKLMQNIAESLDYLINIYAKRYMNIKFPMKSDGNKSNTIYDIGEDKEKPYDNTQADGEDSVDVRRNIINIEFEEFYEFLKYIRNKYDISWRDLHSSNIMIGSDGNYKLSDVGLFRI
jgi:hypothetical protein